MAAAKTSPMTLRFGVQKTANQREFSQKTSKLKEPQKEPTARERAIKMKNW